MVGGATKEEAATKEDTTTMAPVEQMEVLLVQYLVGKLDEIGCGHLGSVHWVLPSMVAMADATTSPVMVVVVVEGRMRQCHFQNLLK